ncbi:hypothetical protein SIL77_03290 [Exiguobacterium profundum]|uniref:hypothetical protein n=1 Tax=Exiguobacterium profundum TaxID=307643 RepID=UPI0029C5ED3E|nr:hypothetical protein [Exiguobacterium profundum]MDX5980292.1 hypothetical protein [Exiguobacterium profundum]
MERVFKDQFIAAGVDGYNSIKQNRIDQRISEMIRTQLEAHRMQDQNFESALSHLAKMRVFLSSPENILGTMRTKHGEIAEHLEVHVRNAKNVLSGFKEVATFDGVGRTAPEDFLLNGIKIQSKFINGTNNTLSHVFSHFQTYKDDSIQYMIPKDQFAVIEQIRNGQNPGALSNKTVRAILSKIKELEATSGKSFDELVKPSISDYDDVQLGKVFETVSKHQDDLIDQNHEMKKKIDQKAKSDKQAAQAARGPSLGEGVKVAGGAAVVSATITTLTGVYSKIKSGKKIDEFDAQDWKELGLEASKSGGKAFVSAGSIYALTNLTALSAPFAGAVTSAAIGVGTLINRYMDGEIDADEVVTEGQVLCFEAGVVAIGAVVGQALIPVPGLGAVIGTIATNLIWQFTKGKLGEREEKLKKVLDAYYEQLSEKADAAYRSLVDQINKTYARFQSLVDAAFDLEMNTAALAAASIVLAEEMGVDSNDIIHNHDELDAYFLL